MGAKALHIATNLERFPTEWELNGKRGTSQYCVSFEDFWKARAKADLLLVNCDPGLSWRLGLLFRLMPWTAKPLLANDLVLLTPKTGWKGRLSAAFKRFSLGGVTHFTHHFRDLSGYERYYGINPARSSYLPFKSNLLGRHKIEANPEGSYVLCFGRSERDYDTFFAAMEKLPEIPAAIPEPDWANLSMHGSVFTRSQEQLPANVEVMPDEGGEAAQIRFLSGAKLVVLPLIPDRIKASGVSVCLNAMLLGKCVVTSEGPGTSDVLNGEAALTPPGNVEALVEAIAGLWAKDDERRAIAARGRAYALACGTEADSHRRILARALEILQ